jgi:DeoR family transcriptional regulator, fructose operon transcriptional repressor
MKVADHIVQARREKLAAYVQQHHYAPLRQVCRVFAISLATARRDLNALARTEKIQRTYGGVLSEYNVRFTSFRERRSAQRTAKQKIAAAAYPLLEPNGTYYFDGGTTVFALAAMLEKRPIPLRLVTNNLLVAECTARASAVEVHLLGGRYWQRQSLLLDQQTRLSLKQWRFDGALLGAEGMTAQGLWNSNEEVAQFQQTVMSRAHQSIFCLDATKCGQQAPCFLSPWKKVDVLISDVTRDELDRQRIILTQTNTLFV